MSYLKFPIDYNKLILKQTNKKGKRIKFINENYNPKQIIKLLKRNKNSHKQTSYKYTIIRNITIHNIFHFILLF